MIALKEGKIGLVLCKLPGRATKAPANVATGVVHAGERGLKL